MITLSDVPDIEHSLFDGAQARVDVPEPEAEEVVRKEVPALPRPCALRDGDLPLDQPHLEEVPQVGADVSPFHPHKVPDLADGRLPVGDCLKDKLLGSRFREFVLQEELNLVPQEPLLLPRLLLKPCPERARDLREVERHAAGKAVDAGALLGGAPREELLELKEGNSPKLH